MGSQGSLFDTPGGYSTKRLRKRSIDAYKFIDLFAGVGGFRMGFEGKDARCVFSSEWDPFAAETYEANFKERPFGDINTVEIDEMEDFHILLAGFPCQPFSKIGLKQGFKHKTQGNLFFNIVEILRAKRPVAFVLENVTGLLNHMSGEEKTLDIMTETLSELGYEVNLGLLNAADFGVPQNRKRVFLVGFDKEHFSKPTGFKFPKPRKKRVMIKDILESGPPSYRHKNSETNYGISKHLQGTYIYKKDDGKPQVVDQDSEIAVGTLVSTYHKIQRITGTFVKDGSTGLRLLSVDECKGLMGFPKRFKFPVSRTQMYRQLGNSVVVPVVAALAKEVKAVLDTRFTVANGARKSAR